MPITILDYVKSQIGEKDSYSADDCHITGVDMVGGCELCPATIAAYNAYPSKSGYWRCADCISDTGFSTVAEFIEANDGTGSPIDWMLRLRQLWADGMDRDTAIDQIDAEANQDIQDAVGDSGSPPDCWFNCPVCGEPGNVYEIRLSDARSEGYALECGECGSVWSP